MSTEKKDENQDEVKRVRLDSKWCGQNQLGSKDDFVEYEDISQSPPVKERLDFNISSIPADMKTYLMSVASDNGMVEDISEVQSNYEDLYNAESLGLNLKDILAIKKNKPIGVYETITLKVQKANGSFTSFKKTEVEKAKNSEGPENSSIS